MINLTDVRDLIKNSGYKLIIVADAESVVSKIGEKGHVITTPAGGVSVALDPIARATEALYIARAKNDEEKKVLDDENKMLVGDGGGSYSLKRIFVKDSDFEKYYYGFSNQTLWPLCHVAFEKPIMNEEWYEGYRKVNKEFADAIKDEIDGKTIVWIQDYQLSLVPAFLNKPKDTIVAMFWHIPWPTWEVFRILPYKRELLKSFLACDFLAFHRGYQARNFLDTVGRELETRIDAETGKVYFENKVTQVKSYPLGIDIDVVRSLVHKEEEDTILSNKIKELLGIEDAKPHPLDRYFSQYKVIFGVDRLDYTKGLVYRLKALDKFFEKNPEYLEKVVYLGIVAPSREVIPSYERVKKEIWALASAINEKYKKNYWRPIHLIHEVFRREDVLNFYRQADACVVTPLDDGMNLVSKEFVVASAQASEPGVLVLSQFAGSATDLTEALIVNPYDIDEVARAIRNCLKMGLEEKKARVAKMVSNLEEKNIYEWAYNNLSDALRLG